MKHVVSLSCASILVSLCSVYGFPSEIEVEPGKSSGWGSGGSGWSPPTDGTTVSGGETIVITDGAASISSSDDIAVSVASPTFGTGSIELEQVQANYQDVDIFTDTVFVGIPFDYSASAGFTEIEGYSNNTLLTVVNASSLDYGYLSEQPSNVATFSVGGLILSNWATINNGTNVATGTGGGWGSGWKQEDKPAAAVAVKQN